jgi:hypothetical protein
MTEKKNSEKRRGPRRWSDEQLYKQASQDRDRLFQITQNLATQLGTFHQSCAQNREIIHKDFESKLGEVRNEAVIAERRIFNRFFALYILIIVALVGLVFNLIKDRITWEHNPLKRDQPKIEKLIGGKHGQSAVGKH